jgi:hypothetical protein
MNFSGNNNLSISEQTGVSFAIDLYLNNINGTCNLGFKEGNTRTIYPYQVNDGIFNYNNIYIYNGGSANTLNTIFNSGEFQAGNSNVNADLIYIKSGSAYKMFFIYDDGVGFDPITWQTAGSPNSQNNTVIASGSIIMIKSLTNKSYTINNTITVKRQSPYDINFNFTNGKIFDPENKLIYTYNPNENIKLSGNINCSGYDYYINNYYLSNISSKKYEIFDEFYFNTSGCAATAELYINGDRPNYKLVVNIFY